MLVGYALAWLPLLLKEKEMAITLVLSTVLGLAFQAEDKHFSSCW